MGAVIASLSKHLAKEHCKALWNQLFIQLIGHHLTGGHGVLTHTSLSGVIL